MATFAFLLSILTVSGAADAPRYHTDIVAIDTGLTLSDCLARWEAFDPSGAELVEGLAVYVSPVCELES